MTTEQAKKFFGSNNNNMENEIAEDLVTRKQRLESFDVTTAAAVSDMMFEHNNNNRNNKASSSSEYPARPIPVPQASQQQQHQQQSQSAASSQGSSGSAFLSSVLNPTSAIGGNNNNNGTSSQQQQHQLSQLLSHTPPGALGSSYESKHFGKRARSGSVSGRLRSASEYLEQKGLLDPQTKGILKDLIIIGDEELQEALDHYESGDPSSLEEMIQSGALQNRLPQDLDILGDLDLDFLTMDESAMVGLGHAVDDNIEALPGHDDQEEYLPPPLPQQMLKQPPTLPSTSLTSDQVAGAHHLQQLHQGQPNMVSPNYDDGIGDLEFAGEFVSDQTTDYASNSMQQMQPQLYAASKETAHHGGGGESEDESALSEYERRMRSNSLYSALLNEPRSKHSAAAAAAHGHYTRGTQQQQQQQQQQGGGGGTGPQYGQWMDSLPRNAASAAGNTNRKGGISIAKTSAKNRRSSSSQQQQGVGGLAASLEVERKKREKEELKERKKRERLERKEKKLQEKKKAEEMEEHVPGSGRPHSLDDPLLKYSIDKNGLQICERPEGWVGAYSPTSRKVRIERFLEKRNHRVWTKSVKYDVRKNFADSRLRVKGRFVKKEDEMLMRELMSLT